MPERYKVDIISQGITSFTKAVDQTRNVLRGEQLCAGRVPDPERKDRGAGETSVRQLTTEEPSALQEILTRLEQLERRAADTDFFSRSASGRTTARGRGATGQRDSSGAASSGPLGCFVCGSTGHIRRNCRFRNHTCYGCGETGHLVNRCPRSGSGSGNDQRGLASGNRTRGPADK